MALLMLPKAIAKMAEMAILAILANISMANGNLCMVRNCQCFCDFSSNIYIRDVTEVKADMTMCEISHIVHYR